MPIEKTTWFSSFSKTNIPPFLCPRCRVHTLKLDGRTFASHEPQFSKDAHSADEWEPEWVEERFVALLKCSDSKCDQTVAISGDISAEPVDDDNGGWKYEGMLQPNSMTPAPPIISLPQKIPPEVDKELRLAFQFYWSDYGACATKIRTSVERLMDHFKVPRFRRAKDPKKPTAPGKLKPLDLSTRIDRFISDTGKVVHKDHLHALRAVGNLGTHHNNLGKTEILEAFEVYEHALSELIDKKSDQIAKTAKKLQSKKLKKKKKEPWDI